MSLPSPVSVRYTSLPNKSLRQKGSNSTDHDKISPPSLNSSFYIDPSSFIQITENVKDSNSDEKPPVLTPIHPRSILRPPKKFTPSDYVRARKQIFPETVKQKHFTDLPFFCVTFCHLYSITIYYYFSL